MEWHLHFRHATRIYITQKRRHKNMPTNFSVVAGNAGVFQVVPNGALAAAPAISWSVDDTANVTLSGSPDADPTKIIATVLATDSNPTFTLTVTALSSSGTTLTDSQVVQVSPAPPAPATSLTIVQLS